ncbi:MAG: histidine kinase, partial [Chitinophagaceae bacterium]|nr:histidine kinase [Chitinophagaceae bacterium]
TGRQDAIAFHFTEKGSDIVILSAAHDELGNQNLKQLLVVLIVACAGGVIVAIGSGYFFSRQLLSPLSRIADQVNEISAQNLASRIPTGNTRDEWHYLTDTLNRLLNRLQESFDTQRRFISNASHELSTPLTSVSSQLQVYLQKERTPAEYRQVLESVYQDVQHLSQLTRTLLEFAKTSGDTGGLELNTLRIDELLLRLPSELQKNNPAHSVSLSFNDLPEDEQALFVFGNEELLFTAIRNIVENACKYSTDSRAEVALSAQEGRIEIIVSDNGKGISEAHLNTIFEPFFREADLRSTEGFGLGLALAQKIIKLHKGSIEVKSVVGTGSAFIITLPSTGRKF